MAQGEESFCPLCGRPTLEPDVYRAVRALEAQRSGPLVADSNPPAAGGEEPPSVEQQEAWVKIGVGGMLAALLFFVVYLLAYLTYF
jgi:hypothetical protein